MATHIALEEVGLPYRLTPVSLRDGQHRTEEYRRIHPLARVPALEVAPGVILTETPALLQFVADGSAELGLMPSERLLRARANEWMSLAASTIHVAFMGFFRPERFTSQQAAAEALGSESKQHFCELLHYVETRLPKTGFVLGSSYSLCDAYMVVFFLWAQRFQLPVAGLPRYRKLAAQVLARPAVRRALEQEGFGALYEARSL